MSNVTIKVHHVLPEAPSFVLRTVPLRAVDDFFASDAGVLALVGIGGSGKTALTRYTLDHWAERANAFVWSFYEDPDASSFFRALLDFFGSEAEGSGSSWFYILQQAFLRAEPTVLVLDGLERIQRATNTAGGLFGELEDPFIRGLLTRLAAHPGTVRAVLTSRFPVPELERYLGTGYVVIETDDLEETAARTLVSRQLPNLKESESEALVAKFGRHALTLDLAAAFLTSNRGPVPLTSIADDQAGRLSVLLDSIAETLTPLQLDLLYRLCVFRFGVALETVQELFAKGEEAVSGELSAASAEDVAAACAVLERLRLVRLEVDGKLGIHPAIRDHFYGEFRGIRHAHSAVTRHLLSLAGRPGVGMPTEKRELDLLEELVYHANGAGQDDVAQYIYFQRLGGAENLNVSLGEYSRTFRILRSFADCPDATGMYQCLRAFGQYDSALVWRPQNRHILIGTGRLDLFAGETNPRTRQVLRFLRGDALQLPERLPDFPMSTSQLFLEALMIPEAEEAIREERRQSIFQDDQVKTDLAAATVAHARGRFAEARRLLDDVAAWVVRSGSREHMCAHLLAQARLSCELGELSLAHRYLDEAQALGEEAGLGLFLSLIGCARAVTAFEEGRVQHAAHLAEQVVDEASFIWARVQGIAILMKCRRATDDPNEVARCADRLGALLVQRSHPAATHVVGMTARPFPHGWIGHRGRDGAMTGVR